MRIIFFLTVFLNFIYFNFAYSNESYVVLKINNKIITNIDIKKEYRYLVALSPELKNIEEKTLMKLAKDSLIREMIKEDELIKYFDLSVKNKFMDRIITTFYQKMGMNSKNEFKEYLSENNLKYKDIEEKIHIEAAWNDLIYKKFSNRIEIDELKIKKELKKIISSTKKQNLYSISELLFTAESYEELQKKYKIINKSILEIGFNNSANIHSVADTGKLGGKIGWVNESQLNEIIKEKITNLSIGEHTKPITIPGGFIIIKLDDKKKEIININFDDEFNKKISNEKNSQLMQFSEIYFKKIKKNSTISEK